MISGACTRHAHKPLSENLPACRRRGGKFRVFSAFFEEKPGNRRLSRHYFAISGRSLSSGCVRPVASSDPALSGAALLRSPRRPATAASSRCGPLTCGGAAADVPGALAVVCGSWRVREDVRAVLGGPGAPVVFWGLNAGEPQPCGWGSRPCNDVPAVTYSPTPSRVQYHRRCGS